MACQIIHAIAQHLSECGYNVTRIYDDSDRLKVEISQPFWKFWTTESPVIVELIGSSLLIYNNREDLLIRESNGEIIDLTNPNAASILPKVLRSVASKPLVKSTLNRGWHLFGSWIIVQSHNKNCTCSYCGLPLWPFLWLPKDKSSNSWRIIALPWFRGRRFYLRWTLPKWK